MTITYVFSPPKGSSFRDIALLFGSNYAICVEIEGLLMHKESIVSDNFRVQLYHVKVLKIRLVR
jgi:hypothetical protein